MTAGIPGLLAQQLIDRWGRCAFAPAEVQAAFGSLVQGVEAGLKP